MALQQGFLALDPAGHDVKGFDCGKPVMNEFISRYASKNARLGLSATWVLVDEATSHTGKHPVAAYFTLASATVHRENIPTDKNLPGYPVPVILLARLAIDHRHQGQGLGAKTLVSALRRAIQVTDQGLPALGVILDVLDKDALAFYQRFELFEPFTDDPMRLFAPMQVLRKI